MAESNRANPTELDILSPVKEHVRKILNISEKGIRRKLDRILILHSCRSGEMAWRRRQVAIGPTCRGEPTFPSVDNSNMYIPKCPALDHATRSLSETIRTAAWDLNMAPATLAGTRTE